MACLAIALQPVQGPDLLLQTKVWFPPKRALAACQSFRTTRHADSSMKHHEQPANQALMLDRLGDDPLAAASGQVVVGSDRRYRVVYRLVNSMYVLGLMLADDDETSLNVYSCISTVNQAVSVLVAACKGVDVTPEKIFRKYTEVYMAFFYVLQGIGAARLSAVLSYVASDGAALLVPLATQSLADGENRSRGAASWPVAKAEAVERLASVEYMSSAHFELPEEAIAAGDKAMNQFAPAPSQPAFEPTPAPPSAATAAPSPRVSATSDPLAALALLGSADDPFAASDSLLGGGGELTPMGFGDGGFGGVDGAGGGVAAGGAGKKPENDPASLLAELEAGLSSGPPPSSLDPFASDSLADAFGADLEAEGLGGMGGMGEDEGEDAWGTAFGGSALLGGDGDAWGGGLDAAEFGVEGGEEDAFGLGSGGGLGAVLGAGDVAAGGSAAAAARQLEVALGLGAMDVAAPAATTPTAAAAPPTPSGPTVPTFRVEERISAEFLGSSLPRVRLSGTLLLTLPPAKGASGGGDALLGGGGAAIGGAGAKGVGMSGDADGGGSRADEFSFRLEGSGAIKRCTIRPGIIGDLGKGYFHFRMPPPGTTFPPLPSPSAAAASPQAPSMADLLGDGDEGMGEVVNPGEGGADGRSQEFVVMKYRLQPRYTPIPLRLRFVTRRSDEAFSLMIQYVANPYLQAPLVDVTFILSLAFSPASLRINPEAQLDPWTKELRWHVPQINPQDPPQRLRAQIPVIPDELVYGASEQTAEEKQAAEDRKATEMAAYRVRVEFACPGASLSGVTVGEVMATGKPPFAVAGHSFCSSEYLCS